MSNEPTPEWNALYDAHVIFIKELAIVNQSYCIYRVVGINTKNIRGPGKEFVNFAGMLGQRAFVIGIDSLFERGKNNDGDGLCSIRGLISLAEKVPLTNQSAHVRFAQKYGVTPTDNWLNDVRLVLKKAGPIAKRCMTLTSRIRNTRIAHLEHPIPDSQPAMLPGLDASEKIIELAYDFYLFIACGFLHSMGSKLPDHAGLSLMDLLRQKFELSSALYDLPHEASPGLK